MLHPHMRSGNRPFPWRVQRVISMEVSKMYSNTNLINLNGKILISLTKTYTLKSVLRYLAIGPVMFCS